MIRTPMQRLSFSQPQEPVFLGTRAITAIEDGATGSDFFCRLHRGEATGRKIVENTRTFSVLDGYPVNRGHALVVPKRCVGSFFDLNIGEMIAMYRGLRATRKELEIKLAKKGYPQPDGYNVGFNVGCPHSGQTVDHVHAHLIPRYAGDVTDPTGGVRGVIPERQKYSGPPDPTVDHLLG